MSELTISSALRPAPAGLGGMLGAVGAAPATQAEFMLPMRIAALRKQLHARSDAPVHDFIRSMIATLEAVAARLPVVDLGEEARCLADLKARQHLAAAAVSLSLAADRDVLRLF